MTLLTVKSAIKPIAIPAGKQDFFIFDLTLVENWDGSPPCRDCNLLYRMQGIPVYLIDGSTYAAVFPLPNTSKSLVFKEKTDFFYL